MGPVGPLGHCDMSAALELDFGALYFRCRGVLNVGALYFRCRRVLSKVQLAGVQNPDPLVQTGLRIIRVGVRVRVRVRVMVRVRAPQPNP